MKKLSTYLFLIFFSFQTPSWADDISDFEIEGMSIGDSLLDYFSKKEIKDNTNTDYYTNNTYTSVSFNKLPVFEIYESVEFNYKTDDKKYIIAAIVGGLFCEENIEKCNKKQKEIDLELSNVFKNAKRVDDKGKHGADKSGKSTLKHINFWLISGDVASIELVNWSEEITNENRWVDNVKVTFRRKEFNDFLGIAFK
jgi:hypothetical protein